MTLNPDTRVIVCCYEGDMHQINVDAMKRHECPVTIMSPEDSKAIIPGVDCAFAGKRAYIGQESLDRQLAQMKLMLTYPENFFLCHDSDSVLLDAKIPGYLYESPHIVWSNQVNDGIPEHQATFPPGWPHVAFQPPYFFSRYVLEKMVAAAESGSDLVRATPMMPFIDYYLVQLTMVAGLEWKGVADHCSCPIAPDPLKAPNATHRETLSNGFKIAMQKTLIEGAIMMHSIKDPNVVDQFIEARKRFLEGNPNPPPVFHAPLRVGRGCANVNNRGIGLRGQRQGRAPVFADPRNRDLKA
jgi:hypothetical protein